MVRPLFRYTHSSLKRLSQKGSLFLWGIPHRKAAHLGHWYPLLHDLTTAKLVLIKKGDSSP
jgi:hypothetical protein